MNERWKDWGPVPLRIVLGIGFLYHGLLKVFDGDNRGMFFGMLQAMGVPMHVFVGWVVALVEVFGGIALILGAGVLIGGILLLINMIVALFGVHLEHGFGFLNIVGMDNGEPVFGMPGFEVNLLYIAGLLALILWGAGAASIDRMLARKRRKSSS